VFELLFAPWRADVVGEVIERAARLDHPAWMLSNHDFGRAGSRIGERYLPAAAMLLLTLPGTVFLYQGDEIGLLDGPDGDPPDDRFGRDRARHPMQWDAGATGGFTTGTPWLPAVDPPVRNVAAQRADPTSLYSLHRRLIALRRGLRGSLELVAAEPDGLLAYRRGDALVVLNLGPEPVRPAPPLPIGTSRECQLAELVLATPGAGDGSVLEPGAGAIFRAG
jgi:alpha-glucosidase